jgi:LysM repeat protein
MRRGLLLIVSLGINVAFALMLFYLARHNTPVVINTATDAAPPATNSVKTQYVVRKQFFSWNEVESPDYPVYIARLRDIGCPEETIRDIVVADVNKLYAARKLDEVPSAAQEWWRSDPDSNLVQAANAKIQALDDERLALLNTLLGPNWQTADTQNSPLTLSGPVLGELARETKQAVRDIVARSQQRTRDYLEAQRSQGKPAGQADLARIEQQTRADLAKILTPAQLEEFLLRYSSTADDLRNQLRGFDVTPDEFRNIFRLRDPLVQQISLSGGADADATTQAALGKQLDDTIKNVLGPERFRDYQLSQDPAFRDAVSVGEQYGAPSNVVMALYRLNLQAKKEQDRINNDPTLTPEQKQEQLQQLTDQEQSTGDQLLGFGDTAAASPTTPTAPPMPPPMAIHQYSPGETIDQIAAQYGVSAASIIGANPDLNLNVLQRGTPIRIPMKQ